MARRLALVILAAAVLIGGLAFATYRVWSVYRPSVEPVPQSLVEDLHLVAAYHALTNLDERVGTVDATHLAPAETKHEGDNRYVVAGDVEVDIDGKPMVVRYSGLITWNGSKETSDITDGYAELFGPEASDRDQPAEAE
ncbi:MAG: hypothetical protein AAF561_00170 [Planctomycetota bacterium]